MSPTPRHSTHKAPILTTLMERCPDVAWGGCWQGDLPSGTPVSRLGAVCQLWVVEDCLGLPHTPGVLPVPAHERP